MAGANNKSLKAAGLPRKTQETVRVARGAGLTVQSAIQHAQAHGLPIGKAKGGEPTGWQRAAAGAKVEAGPAAKRAPSPAERRANLAQRGARDIGKTMAAVRKANLAGEMKTKQGVATRLQRLHAAGDYPGIVRVMAESRDSGVVRQRNPYFKTALTHAINLYKKSELPRRQVEIAEEGLRVAIDNFRRHGDDLPR